VDSTNRALWPLLLTLEVVEKFWCSASLFEWDTVEILFFMAVVEWWLVFIPSKPDIWMWFGGFRVY
jgi:hypothetical protein